MNKLFSILLLVCGLLPAALAGNALVTVLDGQGNAVTNEKCVVTFFSLPQSQSGGTAVLWRTAFTTDPVNGQFTISNCASGKLQVRPVDANLTTFMFYMPVTNGTIRAENFLTADAGNTLPPDTMSYGVNAADRRFLHPGDAATNINNATGTNVTIAGGYFQTIFFTNGPLLTSTLNPTFNFPAVSATYPGNLFFGNTNYPEAQLPSMAFIQQSWLDNDSYLYTTNVLGNLARIAQYNFYFLSSTTPTNFPANGINQIMRLAVNLATGYCYVRVFQDFFVDGNATIKGNLTATNIIGTLTGNATTATTAASLSGSILPSQINNFSNVVQALIAVSPAFAIYNPLTSSNVVYVSATTGNDATAVRGNAALPFASFTNAVTVAQTNDCIYLYAGTYYLKTNNTGTVLPAGVSVIGDTNGVVTLVLPQSGNVFCAGLVLTNNLTLANFTISCTGTPSGYDTYPLYSGQVPVVTGAPSVPTVNVTNVFIYNVQVVGYSDALYIRNNGLFTGLAQNCSFTSYYDSVNIQGVSLANTFTFKKCAFKAWPGTPNYAGVNGNPSRGVAGQGVSLYVDNCTFDIEDGNRNGTDARYNVAFSVDSAPSNYGASITALNNKYWLHSTNCASLVYAVYIPSSGSPNPGPNIFNTDFSAAPSLINTSNAVVNWVGGLQPPVPTLTLTGTTNQVIFGGTNTPPASTNSVAWISVQIAGDTNQWRLGLAK